MGSTKELRGSTTVKGSPESSGMSARGDGDAGVSRRLFKSRSSADLWSLEEKLSHREDDDDDDRCHARDRERIRNITVRDLF